jgi:alpha-tubulin suppressor-like RCC1 family protein
MRFRKPKFHPEAFRAAATAGTTDISAGWNSCGAVLDNGQVWGTGIAAPLGYGENDPDKFGYENYSYPWHFLGIGNAKMFRMTHYEVGVVLKNDGTVWVTGEGEGLGALGLGSQDTTWNEAQQGYDWVKVPGLSGIIQIATAENLVFALRNDGTVWGWGDASDYQIHPSILSFNVPTNVHNLTGVRYISLGGEHVGVIKNDNTLWMWGNQHYGDIGTGVSQGDWRQSPSQVDSGVSKVSCGLFHTMYIKTDGTVWGLGEGYMIGQANYNAHETPTQVPDLLATDISCGMEWSMFIEQGTGQIWTCGYSGNGVLCRVPPAVGTNDVFGKAKKGNGDFMTGAGKIFAGPQIGLAIMPGCELWCWGLNDIGIVDENSNYRVTPAKAITNKEEQRETLPVNFIDVDSTAVGSAAITSDGNVYAWGGFWTVPYAYFPEEWTMFPHQIGVVPNAIQVQCTGMYIFVLTSDGTVWYINHDVGGFVQISGFSGIVKISATRNGYNYGQLEGNRVFGLNAAGEIYAWGGASYGQLGIGGEYTDGPGDTWICGQSTPSGALGPLGNPGLSGIVDVKAGVTHSVAIDENGNIYTWGGNYTGGLIDTGYLTDGGVGASVPHLTSVTGVAISVGSQNTEVLHADGSITCYGGNSSGEMGDRPFSSSVHSLRSGDQTPGAPDLPPIDRFLARGLKAIFVMDTNGDIWAWGEIRADIDASGVEGNQYNRIFSTPVQLTNLEAFDPDEVSLGTVHGTAIKDGVLYAWGEWASNGGLGEEYGVEENIVPSLGAQYTDEEDTVYLNMCPISSSTNGDNSDADGGNGGQYPDGSAPDPTDPNYNPYEPPAPPPPDGSDPNYPKPFTPDPGNFLPDGAPPFDPNNPDTWPDDFDPEDPNFDPLDPNTWPDDFMPDDPSFQEPVGPTFEPPGGPFDPSFENPDDPNFGDFGAEFPNVEGAFPTGPNQFPMGDFSQPMPDFLYDDFGDINPDFLPGAPVMPIFPDPYPPDFEFPEMPCFGCGEVGEITIPEFPIDPCFELPPMGGYDPCGGGGGDWGGGGGSGGGSGGDWSGGGGDWSGGDWGGGGDWGSVPGDGGGVVPDPWPGGGDIDYTIDPPYSTDDTFAEKTCYTDHSARAALEELTARVGVDPATVTYEDERDRNFTKCFEAGTRVWDAIWWLADYLGYVVFDPGDYNVEIVPPEPLDIFWVHSEYIDLIEFTRNYDAMEVYYGVEVYRPESVRGGVVAIPSFAWLEPVNTVFSVDPTNILRIQALPDWTDQQCIDHAKQQASMMKTGLNVTIATPLNMRARFRHQIIVMKPSKNFYMRFMIMKTVHSLSNNGNLSIHECMYKGVLTGDIAHQMGLANSESGYANYFLGKPADYSPANPSNMGIGGV